MNPRPSKSKKTTEHDRIVGARVAALRKIKGLTQTEFAIAIGVVQQQVQKYEYGANRISASRLRRIAELFEVPISTFFDEVDGGPSQLEQEALDCLKIPGAVDLIRGFVEIEDGQLRREILAIVQSIVRAARRKPECETAHADP